MDDDECNDTNAVSITSTPANSSPYIVGETITTRLSGFAPVVSGAVHSAKMWFAPSPGPDQAAKFTIWNAGNGGKRISETKRGRDHRPLFRVC